MDRNGAGNVEDDVIQSLLGADSNQQLDLTDDFLNEELARVERALSNQSQPNARDNDKTCSICKRSFSTAWSLKRHTQNVHERQNYDAARTPRTT